MRFKRCAKCVWCCVFVGLAGRRQRPVLSDGDKAKLAARGRVWDRDNRLKTGPGGECVFYEAGRGCRLDRSERPFDCLLYPFRRARDGGRYEVELACPEVQALLRGVVRENRAPLEADIAALAGKNEATLAESQRIKRDLARRKTPAGKP